MNELVKKISEVLGNRFVVVGSTALTYYGIEKYNSRKKDEIDIVIRDSYLIYELEKLGSVEKVQLTRSPFGELERYVVRDRDFFIEVFLRENYPPFTEAIIGDRVVRIATLTYIQEGYSNLLNKLGVTNNTTEKSQYYFDQIVALLG